MQLTFHTQALAIIYYLREAGFDAYIVGGAVRDVFLRAGIDPTEARYQQIKSYDYDFTTNATPEEIMTVFPEAFYENDFGTVSLPDEKLNQMLIANKIQISSLIVEEKKKENSVQLKIIDLARATKIHDSLVKNKSLDNEETQRVPETDLTNKNFEITTYRSNEIYDQDCRHPTQLSWGKTIDDDLGRRDFTINSLAVKINQNYLQKIFHDSSIKKLPALTEIDLSQAELIDNYHGLDDLQNGLLRCVGEPKQRFTEDALRMLRAVRFSVQLDLEIEEKTWQALIEKAELIKYVSWERIRDELLKMIASPSPAQAIDALDKTGLLSYILPELKKTQGVEQNGHHRTDVWTHCLDSLYYCPSPDPIVRLAALFHDIGKPPTQYWQNGQFTFYNHQHVGGKITKKIAKRLRLSRQESERLFNLVKNHMFHYQPQDSDAAVRRLMREVGLENLDDLLAVREADRLGSGSRQTSWRLEELKMRMINQLHQPFDTRDLKIDGYDLMQELDLKPGKILGDILNYLLEQVLDDASLNEREILLDLAKKFLAENSSRTTDLNQNKVSRYMVKS